MDDNQMEGGNESKMMKILDKIQRIEAQKHLLETTLKEQRLLQSRILSSLQPKVGREFNFEDLENRKKESLKKLRQELLNIAVEEKNRELLFLRNQLVEEKKNLRSSCNTKAQSEAIKRLESKSETTAKLLNRKMNKKVSFHLQERTEINFSRKKKVRMKPTKQSNRRKKINCQNYYRN